MKIYYDQSWVTHSFEIPEFRLSTGRQLTARSY